MALNCEVPGGLFRRCGKSAIGVCKWCGRPYCTEHRSASLAKYPVCCSDACTAKEAFNLTASSARERAEAHNRSGLCGLPSCGNKLPGARCRICGAEYCPTHLSARLFRVVDPCSKNGGGAKQESKKERFFICDQCIDFVQRYSMVELPVEVDA